MSSRLKLAGICFAAAFALAACGGGGGGGTSMMPDPDPTPPPAPVATVMIPDAMYLNEDNAPSAGSMTIAAGDSHTNNGVTFDCPAGGMACEVEVMADGSVTSTGGEAMASLTADAMVQVAQAKKNAADEAARAAQELKDRIIGKDRAIEAASNLATGASRTDAALDEDDITIRRGPSGPASVSVAGIAGYSASDDPALPNGSWAGTHLTRSIMGATQHLFVYTDIEAPERIEFYNFDRKATTRSLYDTAAYHGGTAPVTTDENTDYLNAMPSLPLAGRFSASTADLSQFPAPQSAEEGSRTQRYMNNTQIDGSNVFSTPGNYNGAGGRYNCTGGTDAAPCSVTVAPDGTYTVVGTWNFVPELNATAWLGDQEFMSFGWWLQEPTAQTGVYTFRYYATGTAYNLSAGNLAARGLATYYNGRAAGKFVVQDIDDTGVTGGEAGQFTAAASLTARFSGTGAVGTLQGSISGFQSDNGNVDVSGWTVTLNRQTLTDTTGTSVTSVGTENDPTAAGFDGATAVMGDQTAHGTWSSQFFGQPTNADAYPLGVGGTFQADNENVSIGGAFGARR